MEKGEVAKKVLDNLRGYLQENLHVDVNFVVELKKRGLLLEQNAYQIHPTVETKESKDDVNGLLDYMSSFYDEEMLETFCDFMEEYSKSTDPSLLTIANKIGEEMIKQQVHPIGLTGSQQSDPSGPRVPEFNAKSFMDKYKERFLRCVHTLSIATRLKVDHVIPEGLYHEIDRGKITASEASEKLFLHLRSHAVPDTIHHLCDVMAGQNDYPLMNDLGEDMKNDKDLPPSSTITTAPAEEVSVQNTATTSQNGDIFYPVISDLEDDFSDLATEVLEMIKSLQGEELEKLCTYLANFLKPKFPPSSPPPDVPEEYVRLKSFLISRWDPLQIRVLRGVVRHLNKSTLSQQLKAYEEVMKKKIVAFLVKCKTKDISYKRLLHHSSVAVTIDCTPSEVSLSRILELKEFFVNKLGLGEEHFEGFSTGSTVLYFSVPEDSVWCLPACLHPSNLPQLKEWKVVSLSVEGKFTIDLVAKRIVDVLDEQSLFKQLYTIKELMNENFQNLREKMAEMEKSLRYYEEGDSEGRKVSRSVPIVKPDPMFEVEGLELEPLTKKPKLEPPDYPDVQPKMETADPNWELGSDVEVQDVPSHSVGPHRDVKGKGKMTRVSSPPVMPPNVLPTQHTPSLLGPDLHSQSMLSALLYLMGAFYQSKPQAMGLGPLQPMGPGPHQQMGLPPLQQMESDEFRLFEEEKLKLSHLYWRREPDVLEGVWYPTAVYLNGKIFVGVRTGWHDQQFLCVFDVVSRTWSKLPFHDSCEMYGFTLATSNNKVHTLGGTWSKDGKVEEVYSNKVFSLNDDSKWYNTLPPLNIGRVQATSTSFDNFILVAGGEGRNGWLSSVEVLNSSQSSSTWWEICDLPVKSWLMQCTVTHDELFIGCGGDTANTVTVYTAKLSAVKESLNADEDSESSVSPESFWQSLPKTPLRFSGLVSVNNCLLTVGGQDNGAPHSSVHLYDCYEKTWSKVSDIRKSRWWPAVVVSTFENKQELFVLGGGGVDAVTSVESCELM